ncbi:MAG: hypothetical protein JF614_01755 [Acidobacteria bacterium]|nr:hypothetical protein [Acidobacteriota bacterium]
MKIFAITISLLLAGFLGAAAQVLEPPPLPGADDPQAVEEAPATEANTNDPGAALDSFREELAPYGGQWTTRQDVGEVWVPPVPTGWRPYTNGHWANTDQGWGWVADEPWGWATFHYGRWGYYQDLGWAWVPGNVWAPAWVAWQEGSGYVGWAPLPPSVEFSADAGLGVGAAAITAGFFTLVAERNFLAPRVATVILPTSRNVTLLHTCHDITRYPVFGHRVYNSGVDARRIEFATRRAVPRLQVATMASGRRGERGAFYQPPVVSRAARANQGEFGRFLSPRVVEQRRSRPQGFSAQGAPRPGTMTGREPGSSRSRSAEPIYTPDRTRQSRRDAPTYTPDRTTRSRRDTPAYTPDRTRRSTDTRSHAVPVQPSPHNHPGPSRVQPSQPRPQPKSQSKPQPRSSEKSRHRP